MEMSLFVLMLIPFAVSAQNPIVYNVVVGVGVNLPCKNLLDDQQRCDSISWTFRNSSKNVILFERGQIHDEAATEGWIIKTLGVSCSLQIRSAKVHESGRYTCNRNITSGQNLGGDTVYNVSVLNSDTKVATIKPMTSSTTTTTMVKPTKSPAAATITKATTEPPSARVSQLKVLWILAIVVAVLTVLIIVVPVIYWKKTKGTTTQMDDTTADPEDAVTYVSITYTKKTKNKVQTQEDAEVTYSTVKARSSAAAEVSTEPDIVYAAVNKPKT